MIPRTQPQDEATSSDDRNAGDDIEKQLSSDPWDAPLEEGLSTFGIPASKDTDSTVHLRKSSESHIHTRKGSTPKRPTPESSHERTLSTGKRTISSAGLGNSAYLKRSLGGIFRDVGDRPVKSSEKRKSDASDAVLKEVFANPNVPPPADAVFGDVEPNEPVVKEDKTTSATSAVSGDFEDVSLTVSDKPGLDIPAKSVGTDEMSDISDTSIVQVTNTITPAKSNRSAGSLQKLLGHQWKDENDQVKENRGEKAKEKAKVTLFSTATDEANEATSTVSALAKEPASSTSETSMTKEQNGEKKHDQAIARSTLGLTTMLTQLPGGTGEFVPAQPVARVPPHKTMSQSVSDTVQDKQAEDAKTAREIKNLRPTAAAFVPVKVGHMSQESIASTASMTGSPNVLSKELKSGGHARVSSLSHTLRPVASVFVPSSSGIQSRTSTASPYTKPSVFSESDADVSTKASDISTVVSPPPPKLRPTAVDFIPSFSNTQAFARSVSHPTPSTAPKPLTEHPANADRRATGRDNEEQSQKRAKLRPVAPTFVPTFVPPKLAPSTGPLTKRPSKQNLRDDNAAQIATRDFTFAPELPKLRPTASAFVPKATAAPFIFGAAAPKEDNGDGDRRLLTDKAEQEGDQTLVNEESKRKASEGILRQSQPNPPIIVAVHPKVPETVNETPSNSAPGSSNLSGLFYQKPLSSVSSQVPGVSRTSPDDKNPWGKVEELVSALTIFTKILLNTTVE